MIITMKTNAMIYTSDKNGIFILRVKSRSRVSRSDWSFLTCRIKPRFLFQSYDRSLTIVYDDKKTYFTYMLLVS